MKMLVRLTPLAGVVSAGLLAGHAAAYAIVEPPAERHEVLALTGHGYLPSATTIALAALVAGAFTIAGLGFVRRTTVRYPAPAFVAVAQAAAFTVLEVAERLVAGASLTDLWGPLLIVGVCVQVVLGLMAGFFARLLAKAGEKFAARALWAPVHRPAGLRMRRTAQTAVVPSGWLAIRPARAPPSL